jgi:hypothetical protein
LCGVTIGVGMAATTLEHALVIHAVAAPLIFAAVTQCHPAEPPTMMCALLIPPKRGAVKW